MQIPISTRLEQAWYVDPELWAEKEDEQAPIEIAAEGDMPRNATLTLGEADLEETQDVGRIVDDARHYQGVSLRGALLANDDTFSFQTGLVDRLRSAALPPTIERVATVALKKADELRTNPIKLAAVCFGAGVGTTLFGVLLAL